MFGLIWTDAALQELSDLYVDAPQQERPVLAAAIDGFNNAV